MTPEYFKHHLRPYEAEAYMKGIFIGHRAGWEQARMIASPWRSENSEPLVFPWEEGETPKATKEEIDDVRNWSTEVLNQINSKHGQE